MAGKNPNNSMKDYYGAECIGCFSASDPYTPYRVSLTTLGGLSGASEYAERAYPLGGDIQGAQIHNVIRYRATPRCGKMPYENNITYRDIKPWWGQPMEGTFLNAIKRDSEGEVPTYRDLVLTPVPTVKNESVVPTIYTESVPQRAFGRKIQEGFGGVSVLGIILLIAGLVFNKEWLFWIGLVIIVLSLVGFM